MNIQALNNVSNYLTSGTGMRQVWDYAIKVPGGKKIFSRMVGMAAPYTGSIPFEIIELKPGFSRTKLADRRPIRNHLNSIHAIALLNFAEVTSGVALLCGIPDDCRGILKHISIDYLKKARGRLTGSCQFLPPETNVKQDLELEVSICNSKNEVVAKAKTVWRLGPKK